MEDGAHHFDEREGPVARLPQQVKVRLRQAPLPSEGGREGGRESAASASVSCCAMVRYGALCCCCAVSPRHVTLPHTRCIA